MRYALITLAIVGVSACSMMPTPGGADRTQNDPALDKPAPGKHMAHPTPVAPRPMAVAAVSTPVSGLSSDASPPSGRLDEGEAGLVHPALGVFAPFLGNAYRGVSISPEFEATDDLIYWRAALGGQAVRAVHALADGSYGGESLYYADQSGGIRWIYVSNSGFHTTGRVAPQGDGGWTSTGAFSSNMALAQVVQVATPTPDGFVVSSTLVGRNGDRQAGPSFSFTKDNTLSVVFAPYTALEDAGAQTSQTPDRGLDMLSPDPAL